jgi:hypothetical protein
MHLLAIMAAALDIMGFGLAVTMAMATHPAGGGAVSLPIMLGRNGLSCLPSLTRPFVVSQAVTPRSYDCQQAVPGCPCCPQGQ